MAPKKTTGAQPTAKKAVNKTVKKTDSGETEPVYKQFKNKPVEAIRHLIKVKKGVAKDALYRKEVGYVSIPWGKNDPKTNKGFGLKHIVEKHGRTFKKKGLSLEYAIPLAIQYGKIGVGKGINRITLYIDGILIIVDGKKITGTRNFLVTGYVIKKAKAKNLGFS